MPAPGWQVSAKSALPSNWALTSHRPDSFSGVFGSSALTVPVPYRQSTTRVISVPTGAEKAKFANVPQRTRSRLGFELPLSPAREPQLPTSAYLARSSSVAPLSAPTLQDHELLTPRAPGALQATTSYVPAHDGGALAAPAASPTSAAANARIPARIARECTPLEGS